MLNENRVNDPCELDDGRELEPLEDESDGERDLRCSGSFAEAQDRLRRALDSLTELALRRAEQ